MKRFACISLMALLIYSCKQEEIITQIPEPDPELPYEFVWKTALTNDTSMVTCMMPVVYNNQVFCSAAHLYDPAQFMLINQDGFKYWVSDDDFEEDCSEPPVSITQATYQKDNLFAYLCNSDPRVIDLTNAQTIWHYEVPGADHGVIMTGFGDLLFHTYVEGINPFTSSTLVKANIQDGVWDTIFSVVADTGGDNSIELIPPVATIYENDTLIFFHSRKLDFATFVGSADLYAYNLSADSLLWMVEKFDNYSSATPWSPIVYDNTVIVQTENRILCYDMLTGEQIWTWQSLYLDEDLRLTQLLVHNDVLYFKPYGEHFYALNPKTGSQYWWQDGFGGYPSLIRVFENTIYLTNEYDNKLYAIDAALGTVMWTLSTPNSANLNTLSADFTDAPTFDPLTRRFYITDKYYLLCYQLK